MIGSAPAAPTPASSIVNIGPLHRVNLSSKRGAAKRMEEIPVFPPGPASAISKMPSQQSAISRGMFDGPAFEYWYEMRPVGIANSDKP